MSLAAVGIVSKSFPKSVAFYSALGVSFPKDALEGEKQHVEGMTGTGVRVMLDTEELMEKLHPGWTRAPGNSPVVLAFEVVNVDAAVEKAHSAGGKVKTQPYDAFWGQRYSTLLDPDGNAVDIFAELKKVAKKPSAASKALAKKPSSSGRLAGVKRRPAAGGAK
eukprot:CAMPEP_0171070888 /NCGR_PEP_ID=MMETSP0766_2-20121228/10012_1 /TAXON_ID=439317 /ORGANISM="Gambierdiscus australes, Strain CAWD 149" /LENGTH=163 /DNA_ID=CAMNT_0011527407 /DNA_START=50 /DNA_END=541 /DNA_ORIENTATION=+